MPAFIIFVLGNAYRKTGTFRFYLDGLAESLFNSYFILHIIFSFFNSFL